jgi:fructosamine-3-kinase
LFVKWNEETLSEVFAAEALGLGALAGVWRERSVPPPVVRVLAWSREPPFVVLEWIDPAAPQARTQQALGRDLALLHRASAAAAVEAHRESRFGFEVDNWLGATPQQNGWINDWVSFFRQRRLGAQMELLHRRDATDSEFEGAFTALLDRLDHLIAEPNEPACLLHGDLWAGNYVVNSAGRALLIDPATSWGKREADLAMTLLFGGFDPDFYAAYEEVWPLPPGSRERMEIYSLYHLMNHWNLFGSSYRAPCLRIVRKYG